MPAPQDCKCMLCIKPTDILKAPVTRLTCSKCGLGLVHTFCLDKYRNSLPSGRGKSHKDKTGYVCPRGRNGNDKPCPGWVEDVEQVNDESIIDEATKVAMKSDSIQAQPPEAMVNHHIQLLVNGAGSAVKKKALLPTLVKTSRGSNRQQVQLNSSIITAESVRHGRLKDIVDEEAAEYLYKRDQSPKPGGSNAQEKCYDGIDTNGLPADFSDEPLIPNTWMSNWSGSHSGPSGSKGFVPNVLHQPPGEDDFPALPAPAAPPPLSEKALASLKVPIPTISSAGLGSGSGIQVFFETKPQDALQRDTHSPHNKGTSGWENENDILGGFGQAMGGKHPATDEEAMWNTAWGDPVSDPATSPQGDPVSNPASAPWGDPVSDFASAPWGDPVSDPASAPWGDPVSDPASAPWADPVSDPASAPRGDPVSDFASAPWGDPVAESASAPWGDPVEDSASVPDGVGWGRTDGEDQNTGGWGEGSSHIVTAASGDSNKNFWGEPDHDVYADEGFHDKAESQNAAANVTNNVPFVGNGDGWIEAAGRSARRRSASAANQVSAKPWKGVFKWSEVVDSQLTLRPGDAPAAPAIEVDADGWEKPPPELLQESAWDQMAQSNEMQEEAAGGGLDWDIMSSSSGYQQQQVAAVPDPHASRLSTTHNAPPYVSSVSAAAAAPYVAPASAVATPPASSNTLDEPSLARLIKPIIVQPKQIISHSANPMAITPSYHNGLAPSQPHTQQQQQKQAPAADLRQYQPQDPRSIESKQAPFMTIEEFQRFAPEQFKQFQAMAFQQFLKIQGQNFSLGPMSYSQQHNVNVQQQDNIGAGSGRLYAPPGQQQQQQNSPVEGTRSCYMKNPVQQQPASIPTQYMPCAGAGTTMPFGDPTAYYGGSLLPSQAPAYGMSASASPFVPQNAPPQDQQSFRTGSIGAMGTQSQHLLPQTQIRAENELDRSDGRTTSPFSHTKRNSERGDSSVCGGSFQPAMKTPPGFDFVQGQQQQKYFPPHVRTSLRSSNNANGKPPRPPPSSVTGSKIRPE